MSDPVLIDRLQFTLTVTFHYLFPILTMGLALFIAWLKTVSYLGREEHRFRPLRKSQAERDAYESASRFWAKIFAVNFAVGVVTGIPLEFQFGTNWAGFSNYAGGVIGTTLAMEGVFAFFAESVFLGIFLAGRDRVSPRIHYISAMFVFVGSWLSGFFIIATNAWMQHPVAYSAAGDKVQLDSFWGLLTNAWVSWQYLHNMSGAAITGAFVLAAMGAFFLLSGKHEQFARISLSVGVVGALIFSALPDLPDRRPRGAQRRRAPAGDVRRDGGPVRDPERGAARDHRQPEHRDARAGLDDRDAEAPVVPDLAPLGRDDHRAQRHPRGRWPDSVPLVYYAYHIMVGLGTILLLIAAARGLPALAREAVHVEGDAVGADARVPVHLHRQHRGLDDGRDRRASRGWSTGCCAPRTPPRRRSPSRPAPASSRCSGSPGCTCSSGSSSWC